MSATFAAPSSQESGIRPADVNGHLLIIKPIEYRTGINTSLGEAEAIECDVIDLDTNTEHHSVLFFNIALRSSLRSNIGKTVLSRMGQGIAKPGKSAPWILIDATTNEADVAKATAYLAGSIKAPSPAVASVDSEEIQALLLKLGAKQV
jgi:hypothetical protein